MEEALAKIKTLRGLIPICTSCKKIRSDQGYWQQLEDYLVEHSEADFTHGLCPECLKQIEIEVGAIADSVAFSVFPEGEIASHPHGDQTPVVYTSGKPNGKG